MCTAVDLRFFHRRPSLNHSTPRRPGPTCFDTCGSLLGFPAPSQPHSFPPSHSDHHLHLSHTVHYHPFDYPVTTLDSFLVSRRQRRKQTTSHHAATPTIFITPLSEAKRQFRLEHAWATYYRRYTLAAIVKLVIPTSASCDPARLCFSVTAPSLLSRHPSLYSDHSLTVQGAFTVTMLNGRTTLVETL